MFDLGDFSIIPLNLNDANNLSNMLLTNKVRFQRYFPKTIAENQNLIATKEYIKKKKALLKTKKEYTLALKDTKSKKIIGLVILKNINLEKKDAEIAYCMDVKFSKRGWISKSVNELSLFAFNDLSLSSLYIEAHKSNVASVGVAKKCGFKWQETLYKNFKPVDENVPLDMELFIRYKHQK